MEFVENPSNVSAFDTKSLKDINLEVPLSFSGVDATIDVTIKRPQIEYYIKSDKVKVALSGEYELDYEVKVNML